MLTDIEKLRHLLPHWREHNADHAEEFRSWAEKARAFGADEAAAAIEAAAADMISANERLQEALQALGE